MLLSNDSSSCCSWWWCYILLLQILYYPLVVLMSWLYTYMKEWIHIIHPSILDLNVVRLLLFLYKRSDCFRDPTYRSQPNINHSAWLVLYPFVLFLCIPEYYLFIYIKVKHTKINSNLITADQKCHFKCLNLSKSKRMKKISWFRPSQSIQC